MNNEKYRGIQIPVEAFEQLKEYCDINNLKMGKLIKTLIQQHVTKPTRMRVFKNVNRTK